MKLPRIVHDPSRRSRASIDGPIGRLSIRHRREPGDAGFTAIRSWHGAADAHDHLFHELVYVEAGTTDHVTATGTSRLRPGDVIVIKPQVWHAYDRVTDLKLINCLIDTSLILKLAPFMARIDGALDLFCRRHSRPENAPPVVLHAPPTERAWLIERLNTIMTEHRVRSHGWQDASTALLLELLTIVARLRANATSGDVPRRSLADRTERGVLDASSYIESHFTDQICLTDLANKVHLSPGHLSRSFTGRMGVGVIDYMHRMRAEEACRLLRFSDESVSRIASRVGYDEVAYFSRCFRAQIHQSPSDYRKHWQKLTLPARA